MQARALPAVVKTLLIAAFLLSAGFTIALGLDASAHAAAGW
jgi:hypothetical protein